MKYATYWVAALAIATTVPVAGQTAAPSVSTFAAGMRSIKIEATDFEKSTAFYTALGMKPGVKRDATRDMVWEGTTSNSGIVMTTTEYAKRSSMMRGGTYLMVMTPDVGTVIARLRSAGFADIPEPRQMGSMVTVLFLKDPDGNTIELMGPPAAK